MNQDHNYPKLVKTKSVSGRTSKGLQGMFLQTDNFGKIGDELTRVTSRRPSNEKKNQQAFRNANRFYNPGRSSRQKRRESEGPLQTDIPLQQQLIRVPQVNILQNKKSYKEIDKQIVKLQKEIEKTLREKLRKEMLQKLTEELPQVQLNVVEQKKQNFDFLTNPQIVSIHREAEQEDEGEEIKDPPKHESLNGLKPPLPLQKDKSELTKFNKLQKHYERELDKLYIKRENPGVFSKLKIKNPKLHITSQGNKIQKSGEPADPIEHKMRVFNRENTPCVPELIIPTFPSRKDQMAQSILAYLKEYSPLVRGDQGHEFPKCIKNILQDELAAIHQEQNLQQLRISEQNKLQYNELPEEELETV